MTPFETYVAEELFVMYDDGRGDMAHDVLDRIKDRFLDEFGEVSNA